MPDPVGEHDKEERFGKNVHERRLEEEYGQEQYCKKDLECYESGSIHPPQRPPLLKAREYFFQRVNYLYGARKAESLH